MKTVIQTLTSSLLLSVLVAGGANVIAEEQLSAAEQEALAAVQGTQATTVERRTKLCHHILLHGNEEQKAGLLAELDGQTCSESAAAAVAAEESGQ